MNDPPASHEALYRWKDMLIPLLIGVLVLSTAGATLTFLYIADGNTSLAVFLWMMAAAVLIVIVATTMAFRVHRWTIEPTGVRIVERPKVPLAGFRRSRGGETLAIVRLLPFGAGYLLCRSLKRHRAVLRNLNAQ